MAVPKRRLGNKSSTGNIDALRFFNGHRNLKNKASIETPPPWPVAKPAAQRIGAEFLSHYDMVVGGMVKFMYFE